MTENKKGPAVKVTETRHKQKLNFTKKPELQAADRIFLRCVLKAPDAVKRVSITNDRSTAVPKGKVIHWEASDGDKGSRTLSNPLNPGESLLLEGTSPNGVSCEAWYDLR